MSSRRKARIARRVAPKTLDGVPVPPELFDADSALWSDTERYVRWMKERGWTLPPQERLLGPTSSSPANRRQAAAVRWAEEHGIVREGTHFADLHRLRDMGLLPPVPSQQELYERFLRV
jgi:hypothetical protein